MKKVYVVTDGEKAFMACKSKEDAEDGVSIIRIVLWRYLI